MKRIKLHIAAALMALGMLPASAMAASTMTGQMNVSMQVSTLNPSITASGPLDFGGLVHYANGPAPGTGVNTATTTFDVTMPNGVPYSIGVGIGMHYDNVLPTSRRLIGGTTGAFIRYGYPGGVAPAWINGSQTGTGSAQTYTLQMETPTYTTAPLDSYSDTISLQINY